MFIGSGSAHFGAEGRADVPRHAPFHVSYIWVALATAIGAGFGIGAYLALAIGFDFPLGESFYPLIHAHGHVQLIGWAGLFIMGMSLQFVPRLAGVPLPRPRWIDLVLWLMATGLLIQASVQPIRASLAGSSIFVSLGWIVVASGLLEGFGILLYVVLILGTLRGSGEPGAQPAFRSVRPYFGMTVTGWILYGSLNLFLLCHMALRGNVVVDPAWNEWAIQLFLGFALLPIAFALSVRLFPLYLALAAPDWPVRGTAYAYLTAVGLQVVGTAPPIAVAARGIAAFLSGLGMMLKGGVILWFVWKLDLLTRRRPIGRHARFLQAGPDRPPTRPGLPDYGEFGRFERLVYAAYTWLVIAAFCELLRGGAALAGSMFPIGTDAVRHMYLLGFITHLIFGASVRMIPGFLKKKGVASISLVDATFWLGTSAAICRVVPLILPSVLLEANPASAVVAQAAFAVSGIIGIGAVLCLGMNLWQTVTWPT